MRRSTGIVSVTRTALALALGASLSCSLPPAQPLRIGLNVWPGYEGLHLASDLGYFDRQQVRLLTFPSSTETLRALRAGIIDAAGITVDEAMLTASDFPDHTPRVVLVFDVSQGGDVILAHRPFHSMRELRGHRIGAEATGLGGYLLARALDVNGMKGSDVRVVNVPLFDHERAFTSGAVDAIVTFEPHRSRLLAAGADLIFDSSKIPGEIVDVLMVRDGALEEYGPALHAVVAGWFRARDFAIANPRIAAAEAATREQLSPDAFLATLSGLASPDLAANRRLLGADSGSLVFPMRRIGAFLVAQGRLTRPADPARVLDADLLPAAP